MATKDTRARSLTRDDWSQAGLAAMAAGGVRSIAVEPLAKTLGATKGSFYWHFRDRADLVRAVLERWEKEDTQRVIEGLESVDDPRERLRLLLTGILTRLPARPDTIVALTGDQDELVRSVLERVTARRIGFVAEQVESYGIPPGEASRRALLAYTSYVGFAMLARSAPGVLPVGDAVPAYVETMLAALLTGDRLRAW